MTQYSGSSERQLQIAVRRYLNDPSKVLRTLDGTRLQVLAPGRINVHEGPDFLDMVVFHGSDVRVGCAEFHRRSSDWHHHHHQDDILYRELVLHIVCELDCEEVAPHPTLLIDPSELLPFIRAKDERQGEANPEDIHTYSLLRLLRMTSEHQELLRHRTPVQAWLRSCEMFLLKYSRKRKRPQQNTYLMVDILRNAEHAAHTRFIQAIEARILTDCAAALNQLLHIRIAGEGTQLRVEIVMNCLIPAALAIAEDALRVDIFEWYWSAESVGEYSVLRRLFADTSQQFVWQQQGMLEVLREKHIDIAAHERTESYGLYRQLEVLIAAYGTQSGDEL